MADIDGMTESSDDKRDLVNETLLVESGERCPVRGGHSMFRMLVPDQVVGGILGNRKQKIKRFCERNKARIKFYPSPPGTRKSSFTVSAEEEPNAPRPPAINGLLEVHKSVLSRLANYSFHRPSDSGVEMSTKLLVPNAQVESLTEEPFKSIEKESNCVVRVLKTGIDCGLEDDVIVEVEGDPACVTKAIELIASHLRKFVIHPGLIPLIELKMEKLCSGTENTSSPLQVCTYDTSSQPAPSIAFQIEIPELHADAVIGAHGANMSYMPAMTGATVTIVWGDAGNATLEIRGTGFQVERAQSLIQNLLDDTVDAAVQNVSPH